MLGSGFSINTRKNCLEITVPLLQGSRPAVLDERLKPSLTHICSQNIFQAGLEPGLNNEYPVTTDTSPIAYQMHSTAGSTQCEGTPLRIAVNSFFKTLAQVPKNRPFHSRMTFEVTVCFERNKPKLCTLLLF